MRRILCVAAVMAAWVGVAAGQTSVYSSHFVGAGLGDEWSGAGAVEHVQGLAGIGNPGNNFGGQLLRNDSFPAQASVLTLTDLPPHSSVSIGFLLAIIDSWDGYANYGYWDYFAVAVDGQVAFERVFAIAHGVSSYVPPEGGLLYDGASLGWNELWGEQAFDMTLEPELRDIPHSADSLTIWFFAYGGDWDGGLDESWGIDNLDVVVSDTCRADFNGDGFVTGQDFDDFVLAFEGGELSADYDGDGFVTGLDFDGFVFAFETGC